MVAISSFLQQVQRFKYVQSVASCLKIIVRNRHKTTPPINAA